MKLGQVVLENYGIYSRHEFRFDAAPLVLVFGTNGSGKTTALNGLRQSLYGFPLRNPYSTTRKMSARVEAVMESGDQLSFVRRKGRPDTIEGTLAGRSLDHDLLQQALCKLDLKGYEQLFGFSLDELRLGEDTLKNTRLAEAFAGGSLSGIKALQTLQSELDESLDQLYRPRRTTSRIHRLLADIEEQSKSLKELQSNQSDVQSLLGKVNELKIEKQALSDQRKDLIEQVQRSQKLCQALPRFLELQQLRKALAAVDIPSGVDMGLVARWGDYTEELERLDQELQQARTKQKQIADQLASSADAFDWSGKEQLVENLGHQASEISESRLELAEYLEQAQDAENLANRSLQVVGLLASKDQLLESKVNTRDTEAIETLTQEHARLSASLQEEQARLGSVQKNLDSLASSGEVLDFDLDSLTEHAESLKSALSEAVRLKTELARFVSQRKKYETADWLLSQLVPLAESYFSRVKTLDEEWQVPLRPEIEPLVKSITNAQQQRRILQSQKEDLQKQLSEASKANDTPAENEKSSGGLQEEIAEELASVVKKRDELISNWLDDLSQPLLAATIPVEVQIASLQQLEELNGRADLLHSQLVHRPATEADLARTAVIEQLRTQISQCDAKIGRVDDELKKAKRSYNLLFSSLPFEPIAYTEVTRWTEHFNSWRNDELKERELRKHLQSVRSVAKSSRRKIIDIWPEGVADSIENRVLLEQVKQWTEKNRNDQQQQALRTDLQQQKEDHQQRCGKIESGIKDIHEEFASWRKQLPFDSDLQLPDAVQWLRQISAFYREHAAAAKSFEQAKIAKEKVQSFESSVEKLKQLVEDPTTVCTEGDEQPESLAKAWLQRLHASRDRQQEHIRLRTQLVHVNERVDELGLKAQELRQKIEGLGESEVHSAELIERVRQAEKIRKSIDESNAALEPYCGDWTLERFVAELENHSEIELQERFSQSQERLKKAEERRDQLNEKLGSLEQKIHQLANNRESQSKLQMISNKRLELAELSEQWITQRVAQELLHRAVERFSAENEPELLRYARRYFSQLTDGVYVTIEHEPNSSPRFCVRDSDQISYEPKQLSTGTREQLYLAIRMAFIRNHADHHEPLPVLMDDCFVNFDDQRLNHTLNAIEEWGDSMQTILFSCHQRVVRSLAEVSPTAPIILLGEGRTMPAVEVAERLSLQPSAQ